MNFYLRSSVIITLLVFSIQARTQSVMLDKIVGVVGKNQVLYSDIEEQYMQYVAQGVKPLPSKCEIFEDLLSQKLLVNQADVDSLVVDAAQVEMELSDRINHFIGQIGSEEKLIEYFGKSILEIKEDMRDAVRDQMLMQRMQMEITSHTTITPMEVRNYYKNLPKDSIPYINAKVELNQIVLYPSTNEKAVFEVRERLLALRERIVNGENFATLAVLYSEGPSASKGGDIGWGSKAELDPAYTKAAYALKKGQVSKIVESQFGFHIIQLIDRNEDRIHTRHILMKPKISYKSKEKAMALLDSIATLIRIDTLTFERAAQRFSQDVDSRANGGLKVNPYTGNTSYELDQFEGKEYFLVRDLKVGEISEPYESKDDKGKIVFKMMRLKTKTEPHVATVKDDYEILKKMTSYVRESEIVEEWVQEKIKSTYIRINDPYCDCTFRLKGWQQNK